MSELMHAMRNDWISADVDDDHLVQHDDPVHHDEDSRLAGPAGVYSELEVAPDSDHSDWDDGSESLFGGLTKKLERVRS